MNCFSGLPPISHRTLAHPRQLEAYTDFEDEVEEGIVIDLPQVTAGLNMTKFKEARRRAEIERETKARADFKVKLLAEAAAARERDLLLDYIGRVKCNLGANVGELKQPARDWHNFT